MKKIIAILLTAALGLVLLSGCGGGASSGPEKTAVEKIKEKGYITMYTNAYFPPFEYYSDGEIKGVDVDIANEIAKELGVTLKIESVAFDTIVEAVKNGACDFGAAGMSIKPERLESVNFSNEYVNTQQYLIVKAADDGTVLVEDLAGKKIGVQLGTTGDLNISDQLKSAADLEAANDGALYNTGAQVVQYSNALNAALDLKNDKVDAVVIDELTAKNIVAANPDLKCLPLNFADGSYFDDKYAIAVAKEKDDLMETVNTVLARMASEGTIEASIIDHSLNASIDE